MIRHQIAVGQEKLTADTTEADFCKKEREEMKDKPTRQKAVVKAEMDELAKAQAADKVFLEDQLKAAKKQQTQSAHDLDMAKAQSGLLRVTSSLRAASQTKEEKEERETKKAVDEIKYNLKKNLVPALENMEKERELIHNRCVAKVGAKMSIKERNAARQEEIENLNKAYGILGQ